MHSWIRSLLPACVGVLSGLAADEFLPLFNGRDLTGWVNVNCAPDTWRATNGVIFCTGKPTGELRTTRMYQNFILELEWRHLQPKGNSGVFVWADALTARGQPFIRAVELQVLDGQEGDWFTSDGDVFPIHGARMTPVNGRGGDRAFPTEKRMKPSPEWNHYRVECIDGAIAHAVNGKVVTRGHDVSPRKGYICLEAEGSPIEFRNLRIKELPGARALPPADIADPDDGFLPLYTGADLSGWVDSPEVRAAWRVDDWTLRCGGRPDAPPLAYSQELGDGVLIIDWRWADAKNAGDWTQLVRLRGIDLAPLLRSRPADAPKLELEPGNWNRARFDLRGQSLKVTVNGTPWGPPLTLTNAPAIGVLSLQSPAAPAQVGNLFWKRLD